MVVAFLHGVERCAAQIPENKLIPQKYTEIQHHKPKLTKGHRLTFLRLDTNSASSHDAK